eukprot:54218_1
MKFVSFTLTLLALVDSSDAVVINSYGGPTCTQMVLLPSPLNECVMSPLTGCRGVAKCECVGNSQKKIRAYYFDSTDTTCAGANKGGGAWTANGQCNVYVGQCADGEEYSMRLSLTETEWDDKCDISCP